MCLMDKPPLYPRLFCYKKKIYTKNYQQKTDLKIKIPVAKVATYINNKNNNSNSYQQDLQASKHDYIFLVLIFNNYQVFWDSIDKYSFRLWPTLIEHLSSRYNFNKYKFHYTVENRNIYCNQYIPISSLIKGNGLQIKIDEN